MPKLDTIYWNSVNSDVSNGNKLSKTDIDDLIKEFKFFMYETHEIPNNIETDPSINQMTLSFSANATFTQEIKTNLTNEELLTGLKDGTYATSTVTNEIINIITDETVGLITETNVNGEYFDYEIT